MASDLLARHDAGRLRATLGRASDYFGPHGLRASAGEPLLRAARARRTARWPGCLDQPHTMHFLPDLARGLLVLADTEQADGRAWHLPAARPITGRDLITLAAQAVGVRPRMAAYGRGRSASSAS
jgi:nucleoside-diphosphate-sugar epimerase